MAHVSGDDGVSVCQPCSRDGPRFYCKNCEEHLCNSCFDYHKKATPYRRHVLQVLEKHSLPKTSLHSKFDEPIDRSKNLSMLCSKHRKETIQFFCFDHNKLLCSFCGLMEHRSCDIKYIPEISKDFIDSPEYNGILKRMDRVLTRCQRCKSEYMKNVKKSNSSLSSTFVDLKTFREEINEKLDISEKKLETEIKEHRKQNRMVPTEIEACDKMIYDLKVLSENIKQSKALDQTDRLFIEVKQCENILIEYEDSSATVPAEYQFTKNPAVLQFLENENSLGSISTRLQPKTVSASSPLPTANFCLKSFPPEQGGVYAGEICVKSSDEWKFVRITGMALATPNLLIVADHINECVKMVDLTSKQLTSRLLLSSKPWDVTSAFSNELAVTMPYENRIKFLSVEGNRLRMIMRSFRVKGRCLGVGAYQNKLVVSYTDPRKVEILDIRGRVLIRIKTNTAGEEIFDYPYYVKANSRAIYVSDFKKTGIIKLNWQGDVIGRLGCLKYLHGLSLSADGDLFICESNSVQKFHEEDGTQQALLKDLDGPESVCWCDERRTLYVHHHTDKISIYRLK